MNRSPSPRSFSGEERITAQFGPQQPMEFSSLQRSHQDLSGHVRRNSQQRLGGTGLLIHDNSVQYISN